MFKIKRDSFVDGTGATEMKHKFLIESIGGVSRFVCKIFIAARKPEFSLRDEEPITLMNLRIQLV